MKLHLLLLTLLAAAAANTCAKGGLLCDQNKCHYPSYIEGCLAYSPENSCAQCEHSKNKATQTIGSWLVAVSTAPGTEPLDAAWTLVLMVSAIDVRADCS